jgi:uncharacterized protein YfdQ (DUF2303 family)
MTGPDTRPEAEDGSNTGSDLPRILVASHFVDPRSGAVYVHQDLEQVIAPWESEAHIPDPKSTESFGDVPSWADFVKHFGTADSGGQAAGVLLTWNNTGLKAVLDYHGDSETPGRAQWIATYPFPFSVEYRQWTELANGQPRQQRQVVEKLEDLGANIRVPTQGELLDLLRDLRGSVNAEMHTTWNEDGTTALSWDRKEAVRASKGGSATIPPTFSIEIPILKGEPTDWKLDVRVRVTLDDSAHLVFRLSIPNLENTVEKVFDERVSAAREALGDQFTLYRAADTRT